ncbi:sterol desaturase family protein [Gammaproteobacteria bacterium]|nr:sterol desaturase family protein [Gammaproteobacteria bacterium]
MDLIAIAVPFFLILILFEFIYGLVVGRNTYRVNDTINSLSMGTLSTLRGFAVIGFSSLIYDFIVTNYQLEQLPVQSTWTWITCFVGYDFAYYWKHRLGHEIALFWGSHVSHHQSEDYNLGTALRQTSIDFHGFLFYLPFFFLGFPAEIIFSVVSMNLIYQFWVHTQHVPTLGPLEWIMVTPSNHRVHHARNDDYVDKNYGGVFIIWDRFFGTYQNELIEEIPIFGLRKPLNSWNPLWANIHVYWNLVADIKNTRNPMDKIKFAFKKPGWNPSENKNAGQTIQSDLNNKFNPELKLPTKSYILSQFFITVTLSLLAPSFFSEFDYIQTLLFIGFLAFSLYTHGISLEAKPITPYVESLRLVSLLFLSFFLEINGALYVIVTLSAALPLVLISFGQGRLIFETN